MSTTSALLVVRGIEVEVTYKDIKNVHISVHPPLGAVRVAAPTRLEDEQVRLAVIQRLPWIKRSRLQLRDAARQTEREMVTGETHYHWGSRYRLKVTERSGRPRVYIDGSRLHLWVPEGTVTATRLRLLQDWQRRELRHRLDVLVDRWAPVIGRDVPYWNIRKMKTRWGSCNPATGRIWFNLELSKKDPRCVEYVVVHELVHLLEQRHDARFVAMMDRLVPDWPQRRAELNDAPLAYEDWG